MAAEKRATMRSRGTSALYQSLTPGLGCGSFPLVVKVTKKEELERALLDLWLTTRIPLTRAHLQYHTGLDRKRLSDWLDELVIEGVLGLDVSDDGEMLYEVSGAKRPENGALSFAEIGKLDQLEREVRNTTEKKKKKKAKKSASSELEDLQSEVMVNHAKGLVKRASKSLTKPTEEGDKSLILSSALSFFFGPLGWFYAGSYKEAALGSLAYIALLSILPGLLVSPLLFLAMPISGVAGLVYAWQHNRSGERAQLLLDKGDDDDD